ncbi:hypothetical protein SAMN05421503_2641 [Terribacillus aidingensis]|uniref:Uncharacterized protein n=1 Tax=Terribacillus aidingensis TaxID=586416 RepID=A0A285P2S6_9BACI|nr:hypothetical protein SAMN05421503_2641 [Terribacillus aidingensis]
MSVMMSSRTVEIERKLRSFVFSSPDKKPCDEKRHFNQHFTTNIPNISIVEIR